MKIGAIIQARYRSTRLLGKVLMPLPFPFGKPLLKHITDSIKKSRVVNYLCIATSNLSENDLIEDFSISEEIFCYRGSEDDVLSRFINVAQTNSLDVVIRLTGDNPLIDINFLDQIVDYHISSGNDYTISEGLPIGMNFEIIKSSSLIGLAKKSCSLEDMEHVTKYIKEHSEYQKSVFKYSYPGLKNLRCTVDQPSDFALVNLIVSSINTDGKIVEQLVNFLLNNRWIEDINKDNHQLIYYDNFESEITDACSYLIKGGFIHSANKLKK
jgi:spore coat polysaccharide biosynthesis protein SpsF